MKRTPRTKVPEGEGIPFEVPEVLDRLKEYLDIRTNTELSDILEVKPNTISTWKKRNTLDYPRILSVCQTYSIDIDKIFFNKQKSEASAGMTGDKNAFSIVTADDHFQYVAESGKKDYIDSLPKFSFPFISGQNIRAFQVVGSSMHPVLKEGDYVVGEFVDADTSALKNGSIYVLVSSVKGIYISRVQKDASTPEIIHLSRDNEPKNTFTELEMASGEIVEIWIVTSVFSLDLIGRGNSKKGTPKS
ncbi:LexA family transcriptional regulator [Sinomicrobium sp. M5D2P17]